MVGLALLLLRASVGTTLIVSPSANAHDLPSWHLWGLIPASAALCAGFLTLFFGLLSLGVATPQVHHIECHSALGECYDSQCARVDDPRP
jgi:hypothetical protein